MSAPEHKWSGHPGAYCLTCGIHDATETCLAECARSTQCVEGHEQCEEHPLWRCLEHVNPPCREAA